MSNSKVVEWIIAARNGSETALASLLAHYRPLLLSVAKQTVPPELLGKVAPSSIVQQTCLEALQNIQTLRATTEAECRAWLNKILQMNILDATRRYLHTGKRELRREVPLTPDGSNRLSRQLVSSGLAPDAEAIAREERERLDAALARLPEKTRQIIEWRNRDHLTFVQIAAELGMTRGAVRMMWKRAVDQLAKELSRDGKK
jgi:RNA polymerase sigma-70 factor (ECF subfamily)